MTNQPTPTPSGNGETGDAVPVVRIARMRALPGRIGELLAAAQGNVDDAMAAPGCRSAEVCGDPDTPDGILVISRWESLAAVRGFLEWHEGIAHASLADIAADEPRAVHHPVMGTGSAS